jgi:hypothetical protein
MIVTMGSAYGIDRNCKKIQVKSMPFIKQENEFLGFISLGLF